jgi:hypothetical protein
MLPADLQASLDAQVVVAHRLPIEVERTGAVVEGIQIWLMWAARGVIMADVKKRNDAICSPPATWPDDEESYTDPD